MQYLVVFITAPSLKEAGRIASGLVESKACACVNIIPKIKSVFMWKGKKESCSEVMLVAKTRSDKLKKFIKLAKDLHSYDTPEIISLPISGGYKGYLEWIGEVVG